MSIAGVETCIEVPSWKLCFDIGKCPDSATRWGTVLFTHGHADHLGGVVHHVGTREMRKQKPPRYLIPREYATHFGALMDAWRRLDHSELACEVVPVAPGDRIPLGKTRTARVFRSIHRVPTCGYAIEEARERLKPEWAGRPGEEIGAAKRAGIEIHVSDPLVELVFCGDTTIDVVERESVVRTARRLILETTFIDDRVSREWTRRSGHVHLDDILERADLFENEAILLTHFSQRYSPREIRETVGSRLPAVLQGRVQVLTGP
ncbi:MAG: MBL fold metallo-hydrolase [Myxococcota bacterium]